MPHFSATAYDVPTPAVVDTFATLMSLKAANTTGHRARLRSLSVAGAGQTAQDIQATLRLIRSNNDGDGTSSTVTPTKKDADSVAANITAEKAHSGEPTTMEGTYIWESALNSRGTLIKEWEADDAPVIQKNSALNLQGTPGAATAVTLNVTMEWEEF